MRFDFSETKDSVISTEGEHTLTIVKAEEKKSQNGTLMIVLDMTDEEGGYVRDNVCIEGPGAFRAKMLFSALEIDLETAAGMEAAELIGLEVGAQIGIEPYDGKDFAKVKKYI